MTEISSPAVGPQCLQALQMANDVRSARAELKRRVAAGELAAEQVILTCPREAARMRIAELLVSQRGWGHSRARAFLAELALHENKAIGSLTDRQRRAVVARLTTASQTRA